MGRHKKRSRKDASESSSEDSARERKTRERRRKDRRRNSKESTQSIDKLTEAITTLLERSNSRPLGPSFRGDAVPCFDPEDKNQSAEKWLRKVDELGSIFGWSDEAIIYFALAKLKGLAEIWYKGLPSLNYSWTEWKEKIRQAFPSKQDYCEVLNEMLRRRKRHGESYTKYFHEKMALLNACRIKGEDAVSCIIGGIDDRIVKTGAKTGYYKTPEQLYEYLSQLTDEITGSRSNPHNKQAGRHLNYRKDTTISKETICYKCGKKGHFANKCTTTNTNRDIKCNSCKSRFHDEAACPRKKPKDIKTVALLESSQEESTNLKYFKEIFINEKKTRCYVDFGSSCTLITRNEAKRLGLIVDFDDRVTLQGYGKGFATSQGSTVANVKVDDVEGRTKIIIVNDELQNVPVILGRSFTELPNIIAIKTEKNLKFIRTDADNNLNDIETEPNVCKIVLRTIGETVIPVKTIKIVEVMANEVDRDVYIEATLRPREEQESWIPRTVLTIDAHRKTNLPIINLGNQDIVLKENSVVARGWPCERENTGKEQITMINIKECELIKPEEITVGPISTEQKQQLAQLLNEFRDCVAKDVAELGCAKTAEMRIRLEDDKPFTYRPYRMSFKEQEIVRDIITELLENDIVRESDSDYASPILLVTKKNGEQRMCIDFRKLNSITIKDNHPLPRIDDQIDKLQGGIWFTSLDLRSGYYQIPLEETSKRYTSFVTPNGQYEFQRMPFGLCNAPRVFQRYMNRILAPVSDKAAIYLDDILLHERTIEDALDGLRKILEIFRTEQITLNLKKCSFLMEKVAFLGFEVSDGKVKPGMEKIKAIKEFQPPKTIQQVRQFLGLTGYFRHFVQGYAIITKPLTNLLKKTTKWKWNEDEKQAFEQLKNLLVTQPVLAIYDPNAVTEVHTDASTIGIAGILLQYQTDGRLHPVIYFSRQTRYPETKYHSYELETLAVVEAVKKFRSYLLGINVITDCNALKTSNEKKQLIPRIARWWLQLMEFNFDVKYRPGGRMKHADALSRNPCSSNEDQVILHIEQADWVLAGQLTDRKIQEIHKVLSKPPVTDEERQVYQNYALRNGRVYRITPLGIQWVVPQGMRQQVVRAAHDELGHFSVEKTLKRICQHYWFPRMRQYVEKYISCCIQCFFNKKNPGKREGYLHPIPKGKEPMKTIHIDHLGPFPKSKHGNLYIIVIVDAFTKFVFLRAVKTTKTKYVIEFLKDLFSVYGVPENIISDQGSAFTAKEFKRFGEQNNIKHILNAVATPRANGQVERLNRSILSALMTTTLEEDRWDQNIRDVQFALNNIQNKSTGKTPSQLMFGMIPRAGSDMVLIDEIRQTADTIITIQEERNKAAEQIMKAQLQQKKYYDKKRKKPRVYKEGDIVVIEKRETPQGPSRKLVPPFSGPFVVKAVYPNDRYLIADMDGNYRKGRETNYRKTISVDKIRPWHAPGGLSDETGSESGEDGVPVSDDEARPEELEASSSQDGRM